MVVRAAPLALAVVLLSACDMGQSARAGPTSSIAVPAATPTGACSDPIKCSTPPPGYTQPPTPPCDAPLTNDDEIRAAAAQMGAFSGTTPGTTPTYGDPVLARAMSPSDEDAWLVPMSDGRGGASAVVVVSIRSNGRGCAGMASGWGGPFPRISIDEARRRAVGPNDPVALIEAVRFPFTKSLPPASGTSMVWRVVRQSGREVFLFDSGDLMEGPFVRSTFGLTTLRGEPPGATPRPQWVWAPQYAVATADQALAGARTDPFVIEHLRYLRAQTGEPHPPVADPWLDRPVHVLGLHKPYTVDLWIVPVRDRAGTIVSIISISENNGIGYAVEGRAWSGPFPRVSEADAKRLGSLATDPAVSAQLGWAEEYYVSPGGPTAVNWLVTRRSGDQVVVTEEAAVVLPPR
jgi:hypothetical protein